MTISRFALAIALGVCALLSPLVAAQPSRGGEDEARAQLVESLELRAKALERQVAQLREQANAVRNGAPLDEVRDRVRQTGARDQGPDTDRRGRPGPPEGRDEDHERPNVDELPPRLVDRILEVMREDRPYIAERLEQLRKEDPERFAQVQRRMLRAFVERAGGDVEGATLMLEMRGIERELRGMAMRIKQNPELGEGMRGDLRAALERMADALVAFERHMIQRERERIDGRETRLQEHITKRDELIEERMESILEGRDELSEDPPAREGGRHDRPERDGAPSERPDFRRDRPGEGVQPPVRRPREG